MTPSTTTMRPSLSRPLNLLRKRVLYYGWLGHRNLGDEALFCANKTLLPQLRLVPYERRKRWGPSPKACVLGGGTYINDKDSVEIIAAIQRTMPFVFFGVGVQNPHYWSATAGYKDTRAQWTHILRDSPLVAVRGPHSAETLQNQGYGHARIVGDPALTLADRTLALRDGRHIGLNLGDTRGRLWGGDDGFVYRAIRDVARRLVRDGFRVSLFAVCPDDTVALSKLRREVGGAIELHSHYDWTPAVAAYFRSVDLFVGLKLHSVVLAHCAYVPALMIEYRPKCADYMASLGLEDLTFRSDRLDVDELYEAIHDLRQNRRDHQEALFTRIGSLRDSQKAFAEVMTDFIGRA
jgi:polysaccharide pyruvyl transferase WcaK-like protein